MISNSVKIVAVQLLRHVRLSVTPCSAACRLPCPSLSLRVCSEVKITSLKCFYQIYWSKSYFFKIFYCMRNHFIYRRRKWRKWACRRMLQKRKPPPCGAGAVGVSRCRAAPRAAGGTVRSWPPAFGHAVFLLPAPGWPESQIAPGVAGVEWPGHTHPTSLSVPF